MGWDGIRSHPGALTGCLCAGVMSNEPRLPALLLKLGMQTQACLGHQFVPAELWVLVCWKPG